jgi:hypothetical protein
VQATICFVLPIDSGDEKRRELEGVLIASSKRLSIG